MDKIAKRAREKEMERRQKQSRQDKRIARLRKTYTDRGLLFHIGGRDEKQGVVGYELEERICDLLYKILRKFRGTFAWSVEWRNCFASIQDGPNGEVDFVVVHSDTARVLLIEVTAADAVVRDGIIFKKIKDEEKDAVGQVGESIKFMDQAYAAKNNGGALGVDYLLYFANWRPSIEEHKYCDKCAFDKAGLIAGIGEALGNPEGADADFLVPERIRGFFKWLHKKTFIPDLHDHTKMAWLTPEITDILDAFCGGEDKLITGVAGSGKSNIALHACELICNGADSVLLLCNTLLLAEKLRRRLESRIDGGQGRAVVLTWGEMRVKFMQDHGIDPAIHTAEKDKAGDWDVMRQMVADRRHDERWRFDRIIIDEGQSIEYMYFAMARKMAGAALVLADYGQRCITINDPIEHHIAEWQAMHLDRNLRVTGKMQRFVQLVLDDNILVDKDDPRDLKISVRSYADDRDQLRQLSLVHKQIDTRRHEKYQDRPHIDERRTLSLRSVTKTCFHKEHNAGKFTIIQPILGPDGNYALMGWDDRLEDWVDPERITESKIHCDTIIRYQGMQAENIILLDVDDDLSEERLRLGITRAQKQLIILAKEGSDIYEKLLKAADEANAQTHGGS